jgi:hypothetical protein
MDSGASNVICQGDLVEFFVDDVGHFAIPSSSEPPPEKNDNVTHLRAIPHFDKDLPADFNIRLYYLYIYFLKIY